jgi:caa(3)-type oxidase subunit IV
MAEHAHPSHPSPQAEHAEHAAHEHPNYVRVYFLLLALLCVSVIGPMFGIRVVTIITAFGVAAYKAYLVAKNFMHINVERPFISYLVVTVVVFMLLFFAGSAPDVMRAEGRGWVKPTWVDGTAHAAPGAAHGSEPAPAH